MKPKYELNRQIEDAELIEIRGGQMTEDTSFAYDVAYCLGFLVTFLANYAVIGNGAIAMAMAE